MPDEKSEKIVRILAEMRELVKRQHETTDTAAECTDGMGDDYRSHPNSGTARQEQCDEGTETLDHKAIDDQSWRQAGFIGAACGLVLLVIFVGWPVYQAHHGAQVISLYKKPIALGAVLLFGGLSMVIVGRRTGYWIELGSINLKDMTLGHWIALVAMGLLVVAVFYGIDMYLIWIDFLKPPR